MTDWPSIESIRSDRALNFVTLDEAFAMSCKGHHGRRAVDVGEDGDLLINGPVDDELALTIYGEHGVDCIGYWSEFRPEDREGLRVERVRRAFALHNEGCPQLTPAIGGWDDDECSCDEYGWWGEVPTPAAEAAGRVYAVTEVRA